MSKEYKADYKGATPEEVAEALLRYNPNKEAAKKNPKHWLNKDLEEDSQTDPETSK